jgi:small subunit ribosomal protein S2
MAPYIFKRRNLIHIIDLRQTLRGLITGRRLARAVAAHGRYVLFVGTKKQASDVVEREARRCGMPYVAERWPGGLLTNYVTIRKRLDRLEELEELEETGQIELYGKKMVSSMRREKRKILRNLGGVRQMDRLPGLLVVADPAREHIAINEAVKLEIPIIALTDTDGDPENLDVVVPGNDDSFGAIEMFFGTMSDAVLAGRAESGQPVAEAAEPAPVETPAAEEAAPEEPTAPEPEGQDEAAEEVVPPQEEPQSEEPAADEPAPEAPAAEAEAPQAEAEAAPQGAGEGPEAEPAAPETPSDEQEAAPEVEPEQPEETTETAPEEEAV